MGAQPVEVVEQPGQVAAICPDGVFGESAPGAEVPFVVLQRGGELLRPGLFGHAPTVSHVLVISKTTCRP
jgi:hypothetical protein